MPADLSQIEASQKQTQADLKAVGDQIKTYAERTEKEIKLSGEMQTETRAKVDELLSKQGELQARMQDAEQKLVNAGKQHEPEQQLSAGQLVAAKLAEEGMTSSFRGSRRVEVPRAAITSAPASGGALVAPDRVGVILAPQRRLTIRDLLAPGTTGSNAVEYVRETGFTNNAAIVGEGLAKPYSELTFALENANVRTIAHLFKGSRQILDDAAALQSYIDARARYGLLLAEEAQLLYGNGTGNNLHGIIPQAQAYAAPIGITVEAAQRIDRIRLALLQATLAEFPSTGIVLNPIDWAAIELLKDGEGRYIIGKPQEGTSPRLWNLPVVETQAIVQDQFLVGSFNLAAQIFDRMGIEVLVSTENDKDFENNMVTIRAEERLAFAVYRPEAFVTGDLTAA
ncbi:phage major capsid protein [Pseudomonas sp. RTC3]|uniref:phage major capsid protein n=1 Tax=unclassified Pseudomonas TaxID=196821 RepID=UPI002AB5C576|nr:MULTISPECIES: phage major capsid protein [unclassified Pseudomonas]MEB0062460.1 phage major capsid protein [Pseudomonas sp. RTC3]MDY7565791.1 phage major capsid protein [Pseudomonas sp. 5C2]MEB0027592.1 phage major capsid protein [Pseudomonas sp. MH9.2]MEB0240465.1 phage major capsid protein [Pseudomonas sp. 5C2]WPX70350.1 phage major capsid protein [Pseudomonas sp. MH9.2]